MISITAKLVDIFQIRCIDMLRPSGKSKQIFDSVMKGDDMAKKKQGYNDRMDESLGMRKRGKKKQTLKDRRDEGKAAEKAFTGHAYGKVGSMNKASKKK